MTLTEQLKHIYATGDDMTVLKMLKALIDAVEDYEGRTATSDQVEHLTDKVNELDEWLGYVADDVDALNEHVGHLEKPVYQNFVSMSGGDTEYVNVNFSICGKAIVSTGEEDLESLIVNLPINSNIPAAGYVDTNVDNKVGIVVSVKRENSNLWTNKLIVYYVIPGEAEIKYTETIMSDVTHTYTPNIYIDSVTHKKLLGVEQ